MHVFISVLHLLCEWWFLYLTEQLLKFFSHLQFVIGCIKPVELELILLRSVAGVVVRCDNYCLLVLEMTNIEKDISQFKRELNSMLFYSNTFHHCLELC